MKDILRSAWDALYAFKQAYPEAWYEEDEKVLKGLSRLDLRMSGVKLKWQGLSEEDYVAIECSCETKLQAAASAESILKEKNT